MYALKEYGEAELPDADVAIKEGLAFANKIEESWDFAREFPQGVRTYTHWEGRDYWCARASVHETSYEDMLNTLYHNHTENEAEYIGMVLSQKAIEPSKNGAYASNIVTYEFPFPLKNRDMAIWSTKKETAVNEQFVIVTLPRKIDTRRTKAIYVSVEVLTKLDDNKVKWLMGTASDAGGWVPQFLQRPKLPAAVAEDIPQFMRWLAEWKKRQQRQQ